MFKLRYGFRQFKTETEAVKETAVYGTGGLEVITGENSYTATLDTTETKYIYSEKEIESSPITNMCLVSKTKELDNVACRLTDCMR